MLYSPLNYQGNKSRIADKLLQFIPQDAESVHEIFCGSAILSFASGIERVYLNDGNRYILDLIKYFDGFSGERIIEKTDEIIRNYGLTNTYYEGRKGYVEYKHEGLSRYNRDGYNLLKNAYNRDKDVAKLFVLIVYGFNHYLRFNAKDEFNVPVGKTDFNGLLRKRVKAYCDAVHSKSIIFSNLDFRAPELYAVSEENSLFYFDPPYLITQAPYNSFWTKKDDGDLFELLDILNERGVKFLLSNVLESNGKINYALKEWAKKYGLSHVKRQYLNSSYHKKNAGDADEVVIFNY